MPWKIKIFKLQTLIIIRQNSSLLLGLKKRGFGVGRWNGFGGKVKNEEKVEDAARRELIEECGLEANDLIKKGILDFEFENNPNLIRVHVFQVNDIEGEPVETEEMKPEWFKEKDIPFDEMWPGDIHWIPYLLADKKFKGKFLFGESDIVLEKEVVEVDMLKD